MGSLPLVRLAAPLLLISGCAKVAAEEPPRHDAAVPPPSSPATSAAPASAATPDAGSPRPGSITAHKLVLHVGDSTVGYTLGLQLELARMFKSAGARYESRTVTAAGLHTFATERIVEKAVKERDPDLVIIQIGTNNLTVPHPDVYIPDLRSIVAQAGGRYCYWIGPISIDRPEKGMRAVVRDHVQPCAFYDSYDLDLARQPDGIHPTQRAAKKWAEAFWAFASRVPPGR